PEVTPGGRALKFYASVRLEIRKGEQIKEGTDIVGNQARVKVVKNKVASPFKTCEIDIIFGKGISRTGEVVDLGVQFEIIKKSGSWFAYNDQKIGQGRENAKKYLEENPAVLTEIEGLIRKALNIK
ncbi:MAG: DNA recombination/repair protein RecA, partial [bacterium]|nr:DNA recombination/repair protein RecA [bacterium]